MNYLVTGAAGFIGFHTARSLLEDGHTVVGLDSVNDYYRTDLKEERLALLDRTAGCSGADAACYASSGAAAGSRWTFYRD